MIRRILFLLSILSAFPPAAAAIHPIDAAHADAARLPIDIRPHVRYLRLDDVLPLKDRAELVKVLSGHCNHLSTASELVPVAIVPDSDAELVRVNLLDYGWRPEVWDQLVSPYDHVTVEADVVELVEQEYGYYDANKKWIKTETKKDKKVATRKRSTAIAPWLADNPARAAKVAELIGWLGATKAPVVRARWFFQQSAAQADRKPGYYDFLGVKDEKTFQALIGFDAKLDRRRVEIREAVAISGVTLQPRAIVRRDAVGGSYWYSLDFRKALDKLNPLRVLGEDLETAFRDPAVANEVASEQYGTLPNGLWATFLGNGKGERQDAAPDFIASDSFSKSNDRRVHVNIGCTRCHWEGGLKSIDGWARNLFQPPLKLTAVDYETLRKLRQQYARDLDKPLKRDRQQFEDGIRELTGMTAKEYAAAYASVWEGYEDSGVDLARAAADLGVSPKTFRDALERRIKLGGQIDLVLSVLLLEGERARKIPVRQWEELYPTAQTVLRGGLQ